MMQQELLHPSWPSHNTTYSIENHAGLCGSAVDDIFDDHHEFSSSFSTPESGISFDSFLSTMFSDEVGEFPALDSAVRMNFPIRTTADTTGLLETMPSFEFEDVCKWYESNKEEDVSSSELIMEPDAAEGPCVSLESSEISEIALNVPGDNMEVDDDDQRRLCHLLQEYGAAVGNGYRELQEVIAKRVLEKINPIGKAGERVAFHLLQAMENSGDYLREESSKNIETAFRVFYRNFPFKRLAHFTANAAILETIPDDIDTVHIIDFDMGEGIQWPPVIEAISQKHVLLKLTSIELEDECNRAAWKFEETKKRLYDHAISFGLKLQIEQINLDDLMTELKRMKKRGIKREWFAFNCMISLPGLPHMGKRPRRDHAMEFLSSAKVFLAEYANHRGILTFGDGETGQSPKTYSDYASFFDRQFMYYQAVFDSMERNFPAYLAEARITMESLFLAPYICSVSWLQQWKEMHKWFDLGEGNMLEGRKLSKESILEAKEMVNEATSLYKIKFEGERENEMVLEWKGTPLVRVSSWI